MNLQQLVHLGFDNSKHIPFTKQYRVRCSQCEALVINDVPAHEHGCPNRGCECRECGQHIPPGESCDCTDSPFS